MHNSKVIKPKEGQESVWDYPRPPKCEESDKQIKVIFNKEILVETTQSKRILETSHPPVYYIPREEIQMDFLIPSKRVSYCEWKGEASYYSIKIGNRFAESAAWTYNDPKSGFLEVKNYIAFYVSQMDACYVNDELVVAQPGDFYGGWITSDIVGPFKGGVGTWGW